MKPKTRPRKTKTLTIKNGLLSLCLMLCASGCTSVDLGEALLNPASGAEVACSLPPAQAELRKMPKQCIPTTPSSTGDMGDKYPLLEACAHYLYAKGRAGVQAQWALEKYKRRCIHKKAST